MIDFGMVICEIGLLIICWIVLHLAAHEKMPSVYGYVCYYLMLYIMLALFFQFIMFVTFENMIEIKEITV